MFIIKLWPNANLQSMLIHESIRCEESSASPKSLEQCNTESYSCYKLYVELDENRQNAWISEPPYETHPRASKRGALGGLQTEMGHGLL